MSTDLTTDLMLDALVRDELNRRRGEWQRIATESGVSYSWLSKFVNEHIDNPGYETLKRLHAYLHNTRRTA